MTPEMIAVLEAAIELEQKEHEMYCKLLEMAETQNCKTFFKELSVEELKHEELLKECVRTGKDMDDVKKEKYRDYIIELDVASMLDAFHDISDLEKGFEIAIKQEVATQKLYAALIERTASLSLKRLLKQLQEEENKHERLLLREHGKLFHPDQVEEDGEDEI